MPCRQREREVLRYPWGGERERGREREREGGRDAGRKESRRRREGERVRSRE